MIKQKIKKLENLNWIKNVANFDFNYVYNHLHRIPINIIIFIFFENDIFK